MPSKKTITPATVLEELRALEGRPAKRGTRLLAKHLQCKESLKLSQAVAEAARKTSTYSTRVIDPPSEMLPPLV
ncbi:hypothetical protein GCM10011585_33640 [Edaphobacter dinghuensis]|uniref:Uncharacterized protein n=1 Tax=Edaphobacter dinghuensis TaxID=1560005 RepID=A0A917HRP2_9BACT|nr:hypothetical protein GCM10011585_33640 [Edaphobacter dinghuensis]